MTLQDLTGHEFGVICYAGNAVGVFNWNGFDENEIPILSPVGTPIPWDEGPGVFDGCTIECVKDWRKALPGSNLDIVWDEFGDLEAAFMEYVPEGEPPLEFDGTVYTLRNGRKIICPDNWN